MNKQLIALFFTLFCATATFAITMEDTVEAVAGIVDALVEVDHLKDIQTCIKDVEVLQKEVNDAVSDFD